MRRDGRAPGTVVLDIGGTGFDTDLRPTRIPGIDRRGAIAPLAARAATVQPAATGAAMYGLIGKINCVPGQRDAFAALLLESRGAMPGCLSASTMKQSTAEAGPGADRVVGRGHRLGGAAASTGRASAGCRLTGARAWRDPGHIESAT
jgi:hypothetical protein